MSVYPMQNSNDDAIDQWHQARWAKFTASENHKLLEGGRPQKGSLVGEMFGMGALTYIEERAMQEGSRMWERLELENNKTLLHGKLYEYPAFDRYIKATRNFDMLYLGTENPLFIVHPGYETQSGGSPDIIHYASDGITIDAGAEIKCPKNPVYHFRRLSWKDQWDIKSDAIEYYSQVQNLMLITGARIWHFISYDERRINEKEQIKIIEVSPDKKFQDNLEVRIQSAIQKKKEFMEARKI